MSDAIYGGDGKIISARTSSGGESELVPSKSLEAAVKIATSLLGFGVSIKTGEGNGLSLTNAAPLKSTLPSVLASVETKGWLPLVDDIKKRLTREVTDGTSGVGGSPHGGHGLPMHGGGGSMEV